MLIFIHLKFILVTLPATCWKNLLLLHWMPTPKPADRDVLAKAALRSTLSAMSSKQLRQTKTTRLID